MTGMLAGRLHSLATHGGNRAQMRCPELAGFGWRMRESCSLGDRDRDAGSAKLCVRRALADAYCVAVGAVHAIRPRSSGQRSACGGPIGPQAGLRGRHPILERDSSLPKPAGGGANETGEQGCRRACEDSVQASVGSRRGVHGLPLRRLGSRSLLSAGHRPRSSTIVA